MSERKDRTAGDQRKPKSRLRVMDPPFREDLEWWVSTKPAVARRLLSLIEAVLRDPFVGIGKLEPLKQLGPKIWSRRLAEEHRLAYFVADDRVVVLQGRYHY